MKRSVKTTLLTFTWLLAIALCASRPAVAHCDGMDEPGSEGGSALTGHRQCEPRRLSVQSQDEPECTARTHQEKCNRSENIARNGSSNTNDPMLNRERQD
jgi:hypothetical protein